MADVSEAQRAGGREGRAETEGSAWGKAASTPCCSLKSQGLRGGASRSVCLRGPGAPFGLCGWSPVLQTAWGGARRGQRVPVSRPWVGVHKEARQRLRENRAPGWPWGWGCSCMEGNPGGSRVLSSHLGLWKLLLGMHQGSLKSLQEGCCGLRLNRSQSECPRKESLGEHVKEAARGWPPLPDGTAAGVSPGRQPQSLSCLDTLPSSTASEGTRAGGG